MPVGPGSIANILLTLNSHLFYCRIADDPAMMSSTNQWQKTTPPEPAPRDKVIQGLKARRDELQNYITKFRFKWLFLVIACLIGAGANIAIDIISDTTPSLADWYQGGLAGVGL